MKEEMKRLQREINGKVVKYRHSRIESIEMDAICIWPPDGTQVSIKPYGIPAEKIQYIFKPLMALEIEEIEDPSFCLSSLLFAKAFDKGDYYMHVLQNTANLKEGDVFQVKTVHPQSHTGSTPSCPYG